MVTKKTIDFARIPTVFQGPSGIPGGSGKPKHRRDGNSNAPRTADGKLLTPKQIRARARRRAKRADTMTEAEFNARYKPIEDWDLEELARGRPRDARGQFRGRAPSYISKEVHERAMERFKGAIKTEMNGHTVDALATIHWILSNEDVDEKGKPIVPPGAKLDAAKWLLEHTVGKPTQRIESDISVKLQAILGSVMVNPADALTQGEYTVGHLPGVTMPMAQADDIINGEVVEYTDEDPD